MKPMDASFNKHIGNHCGLQVIITADQVATFRSGRYRWCPACGQVEEPTFRQSEDLAHNLHGSPNRDSVDYPGIQMNKLRMGTSGQAAELNPITNRATKIAECPVHSAFYGIIQVALFRPGNIGPQVVQNPRMSFLRTAL